MKFTVGDAIGVIEGYNEIDTDGKFVGPSLLLQLPTPSLMSVIVTSLSVEHLFRTEK